METGDRKKNRYPKGECVGYELICTNRHDNSVGCHRYPTQKPNFLTALKAMTSTPLLFIWDQPDMPLGLNTDFALVNPGYLALGRGRCCEPRISHKDLKAVT